MGRELRRISQRARIFDRLEKIFESAEDAMVIHYSCESFYDVPDGHTPRVTSIAVRNLESGQTESFSIHKVAEQRQTPLGKIMEHYDELEKEMLAEYFAYLQLNQSKTWIHWNMRDVNYGFQALEHRFKALGGAPITLPEGKRFDLSRALIALYGSDYIDHPRLQTLMEKNDFGHRSFMDGKAEAVAFEEQEYIKLHQSTLRKVDLLANVAERAVDGTLKTDAKWYKTYGVHPKVAIELIREHWFYGVLGIITLVAGLLRIVGVL